MDFNSSDALMDARSVFLSWGPVVIWATIIFWFSTESFAASETSRFPDRRSAGSSLTYRRIASRPSISAFANSAIGANISFLLSSYSAHCPMVPLDRAAHTPRPFPSCMRSATRSTKPLFPGEPRASTMFYSISAAPYARSFGWLYED